MADPIQFPEATARFGLPLLHVAQAQKELFVNEAHALADALLHPVVSGIASAPPENPIDGEAYLVGPNASDLFTGSEDRIAVRQQGQWLYITPVAGMHVYDKAIGADRHFDGGWSSPASLAKPIGGSVIDAEAREIVNQILDLLQNAKLMPGI